MANPVPRPRPEQLADFLRARGGVGGSVFLDFEFRRSQDPVLDLVSCSLQWFDTDGQPTPVVEWWLFRDEGAQADLRESLEALRDGGAVFVGYGMAAECRSLLSLGLDPHSFQIVDLYAEWRQLTHNNVACEYGVYFTETGFRRTSVPPSFQKEKNRGKDNNKVGAGLTAAVGQCFGEFLDSAHKRTMRDLILSAPDFTDEEAREVMAYCSSDIAYLPDLFFEFTRRLASATRGQLSREEIARAQLLRGSFIASVAKMEAEGFPLQVAAVRNLRANFEAARDTIIRDLVENHFPFYLRVKRRASDLLGAWVDKESQFRAFLQGQGLLETWPRTVDEDTGKPTETLSREDKVLAEYDGVPELRAYRQARKLVKQLQWFREPDPVKRAREGDFFDTVGADDRQRAFLGPFGTQTGRNAPKASRFIPAMSSWLRVLIQPPPGWIVYGIDWASQEFAIAAVMSRDSNMMAAYQSGDPYLYFAIRAGAVSEADGEAWKWEKKARKGSHEVTTAARDELYHRVTELRNLFKSTTLGLQYGMGKDKLAVKLTVDTGRRVTTEEADRLIQLHRRVYPTYWAWLEKVSNHYERKKVLTLWDGWALLGDNENFLSVRNFPVQGTGSVTMREAVRRAHLEHLRILTPLHDAIYGICREEEEDTHPATLGRCMDEAVSAVLGDRLKIRQDLGIHRHGEPWIEEKGEKFYKLLGRYLEPMETEEDKKKKLLETIFAESFAF